MVLADKHGARVGAPLARVLPARRGALHSAFEVLRNQSGVCTTYGWWLRFHILWEHAWRNAEDSDPDKLDQELRKAIYEEKVPGGTPADVLYRSSEFASTERDCTLFNISKHYDFIIELGLDFCAQGNDNPPVVANPWTHLFYVLLLSTVEKFNRCSIHTYSTMNIIYDTFKRENEWELFSKRVAEGMQKLETIANNQGCVDASHLWALLENDPGVNANHNAQAARQ
jgi:hypothetical protein